MERNPAKNQPISRRWKIIFKGCKENISKNFAKLKDLIKFAELHTTSENELQAVIYFVDRHRKTAIEKKFECVVDCEPILNETSFCKCWNTLKHETTDAFPLIINKFTSEKEQHQAKKKKSASESLLNIVEKIEKIGIPQTIIDIFENDPENIFQIETAEKYYHMKKVAYTKAKLHEEAELVVWLNWQQHLFDYLAEEPNPRRIFVIVDPIGNSGKSFFVKNYCRLYPNTTVLLSNTREADMFYNASNYAERRVILLDISRSETQNINYGAIEALKNGFFVNSKYRSCSVDGPPPHLVIFTNSEPQYEALSMDRWYILHLHHETNKNITWTEETNLQNKNSKQN
jgi:hypothetical protein